MLWWTVLFAMYFGWAPGAGTCPPNPSCLGFPDSFSSTFQTSSQTFSWIRSWIQSGGGEHQQIAEWGNELFVCNLRRDCKTGSPWLVNQNVHVDLFLFWYRLLHHSLSMHSAISKWWLLAIAHMFSNFMHYSLFVHFPVAWAFLGILHPFFGILHISPSCPVQMIFSRLCSPFEPWTSSNAKPGGPRRAALGPSVLLFSAMPRPFRPLLAPQPVSCSFCHMAAGPLSQFSPGVSAMFLAELLRTFILSSQQPLSSHKWIWWLRWDHVFVVEIAGVMWVFPVTCHMQAAWHPSKTSRAPHF